MQTSRPPQAPDHGTSARSATIVQRLHGLLKGSKYGELRSELARAESEREISELGALTFQALLAMAEGSEYVSDYLEMAEAVAETPQERAMVAEHWATYDLLQGNHLAAAERCLLTLDHVCQTEGLWKTLLIALCRLGDVETIDATLRSFAELDDEYTSRLVGSLSSQPDLRAVHERPAFRELVEKRVICKRAAV